MENKFVQASKKERVILTKFFEKVNVTNYTLSNEEGFDRFDAVITGNAIIEIKIRSQASTTYPSTIIELSKFNFLREEGKRLKMIPLLFVYFDVDDILCIWDLNKVERSIIRLLCPQTTMGYTEKVMKDCVDIYFSKCYKKMNLYK